MFFICVRALGKRPYIFVAIYIMYHRADDIRLYIVERRGRRSLLSAFCFLRSAFHFDEKLEVFVHFLLQSVYLGAFAVHQFIVAVDFFLGYLLGKSVYLRL